MVYGPVGQYSALVDFYISVAPLLFIGILAIDDLLPNRGSAKPMPCVWTIEGTNRNRAIFWPVDHDFFKFEQNFRDWSIGLSI